MSELYWIRVAGALSDLSIVFMIASVALVMIYLVWLVVWCDTLEEAQRYFNLYHHKFFRRVVGVVLIISCLGVVFVPTKKEMLAIYAAGTIVDYVQDNKEAQKVPDKAVKALNKYLDDFLNENKEK